MRRINVRLKPFDLFLGILVTVMWGCNFVVIGWGLQVLDPFVLTFLRFVFSAFPAIFFIKNPVGVSWPVMAVYGVIFGCGLWWTVNFAMYYGLSGGMASLFLQFSAFFTIGLSYLLLKELVNGVQITGSIISIAGLCMMIFVSGGSSTLVSIGLVLGAAFAWSICNVIIKIKRPSAILAFVVWTSVFSAPGIFVMTLLVKGFEPFVRMIYSMNGKAWFSVLFQAYITTILGYWGWNNLMKKYPASVVAPLSLLVPIAGISSSCLFFYEQIGLYKGIAMVMVLSGLTLFMNSHRFKALFSPMGK